MVYLELFHGRHNPDEELDDWGFEGPILGPFPYVHITFASDIKVGAEYILPPQTLLAMHDLSYTRDQVEFAGSYYGDISAFSKMSKPLRKRYQESQKVFQTDPALLIGDKREWVRNYIEWRFKNDKPAGQSDASGRSTKRIRRSGKN